ncbi:G-type lectin S-receptor-like serine/threonine-protein kinase At4g27290 isoform X2 [Salvia splendens]|uniref:G-type lectin S-receptor-like serine/threonine-protein kinase At4g27290 isoform X2 n=1 Tax=Salvia splendens TaxID=180675 RepID=UPI001C271FC7|nr:G-type lectin S-receptor-like serine/threonine-protein kinase At4g27290 isoform X2 [Salvia splendens]
MDEFHKHSSPFLLVVYLLLIRSLFSTATDTITTSARIRDGETLVSSNGVFELGFFNLTNSPNRYVGIWYSNITVPTYVWVANRESPLTDRNGALTVTAPGVLAILNRTNGTVWSSAFTEATTQSPNPIARLLDSGNLIVKDAGDDDNFLWQSFDYPCDTLLAGIRLGWNYVTGVETYISSWKSDGDPSKGEYSSHVDPTGYPQMVLKKGSAFQYRIGPWNGLRWSGAPDTSNDPTYSVSLQMTRDEVRYTEGRVGDSVLSISRLNPNGEGVRSTWNDRTNSWTTYTNVPADNCDSYGLCGPHGSCNAGTSPSCGCLDRFVARDPESWGRADWSDGCVRRIALSCGTDKFLKYSAIKLPDARNTTYNVERRSLAECQLDCARDCSCVAYAQLNISGAGSGCLFYHGDLIDIRVMASAGQDLYIRMAAAEPGDVSSTNRNGGNRGRKRTIVIASATSVAVMVFMCLLFVYVYGRRRKNDTSMNDEGLFSATHVKEAELPFFSLPTILKATDNFSNKNKLGEGGFGPVYRGLLEDGQEIAVKRLSKTSRQGVNELRNEVMLIAKLQHRNLVRTLGFCAQGEEHMLIYEYMPNHSLDLMLFGDTFFQTLNLNSLWISSNRLYFWTDQEKSRLLDWQKRFDIINGIAKGLLYLHQDSRLRIIHRDLKASNILLDADMIPKISDFGLARSFGGNQTEAQTRRVVGTYGYMSPEYAIDGLFSVKSDVFSFGVLVLEIVSGNRNRGFLLKDHNLNLLGHAWRLYMEDSSRKLLDPCLDEAFNWGQVERAIHVGLLCVQNSPDDRPSMSSVVFMLGNEVALPQAKQPGFFTERDISIDHSSSSSNPTVTHNEITITWTQGR